MKLNMDFSNDVPFTDFAALPEGEYTAMITAVEQKDTKAGDGSYLNIELTVLEGEYAGRKVWDVLNLWNKNAKAVEMARRTMRSITEAAGTSPKVTDTDELLDKPMVIRLAVEQQDGYKDRNRVMSYKSAGGEVAAPAAPKAAAKPAAGGKPAWMAPKKAA